MQPGSDAEMTRILAGAELWMRLDDGADGGGGADGETAGTGAVARGPLTMIAGWEDAFQACAPFVAADGGEACRGCPASLVGAVLRAHRAMAERCSSGIGLLAFPAPAGSRDSVGVLRLDPDSSEGGMPVDWPAVLGAARRLRSRHGLAAWQAEVRTRGAERRRTAAAALAQMIATTEEFHRLYTTADRDRGSAEQAATRLDTLARETLRDSEQARVDVAHALHDTAAQSLVSAHRFMEAARASLSGPHPETAPPHIDAAQERLIAAIREVRVILDSLVPPGLEELGIANALRIHVRDNVPGRISTEVTGDLARAEGWLEAGLFAMTVEAVGNAVQHAEARTIQIDLHTTRGLGIITVADDGIGFDPAAAGRRTRQGMGLIGMTRRASWLGGRVDVRSRPGGGTTIRISTPLDAPDQAAGTDG